MGTIADKLTRIITTKEDIRKALISKGYDVPTSIPFKEYAKMILDLPCKADSFPDIEGIVARYSASGLTNEQMAENPVWVDKTGNGHDLQMKNFLWGGMSGVGGYVTNKEVYEYDLNKYSYVFIPSESKVHDFYVVFELTGYDESFEDGFNLDVRSTTQGLKKRVTYTKNGIYTFQYKDEEGLDNLLLVGYNGNGGERSTFTVKFLPLYPGALVFDGVDDYGTCDNFPILTKEKGYTVVALRSYLAESIGYLVYNGTNAKQSAFAFERSDSFDTWSWGKNSSIRNSLPKLMSYQTSNSYNNNIISTGTAIEGDKLIRIASSGGYCNVAIWELVFLDHDATEEELTKIKDYFVKTYPWLFPDQAWTVVGKTNEDEDRATIANITGNGNDLVLSNFGFAEGSGYNEEGEYAGYLVTDGVDDKVQSSSFTMNEDWTIVGDWELLSNVQINCGIVKSQNVYLYNTANGLLISINNPRSLQSFGTKSLHAICSDGRLYDRNQVEYEYTADQNFEIVKSSLNIGFNLNNYTQIAFKNLGIYNNQILSKDDCIKAYNYLQTLKAK